MIIFCDMIDDPQEQEKFELIYSKYKNAMYHLAYGIVKNRYDAEDVMQISLVKLIGILSTVSREAIDDPECRGLIITITRNTAIDFLRRRKHVPIPVEELRLPGQASVEDLYIRAEEMEMVIKCIDEMQESYRTVMHLRTLHQLSAKETAKIMCTNEANVNTMLGRARKVLARKLEGYRNGK